jgi:hypothetical protein
VREREERAFRLAIPLFRCRLLRRRLRALVFKQFKEFPIHRHERSGLDRLLLRTDFHREKSGNDFVCVELIIGHRAFLVLVGAGLLPDGEAPHKPLKDCAARAGGYAVKWFRALSDLDMFEPDTVLARARNEISNTLATITRASTLEQRRALEPK